MLLDKAYLFQALSEDTKREIGKIGVEESHEKGQFLFNTGDAAEYFYTLVEGRVRLSVGGTGHIASLVSEPGEMLGWSTMVEAETYTASAECLVPVKVLKFQGKQLAEALARDPAGASIFYKRLAELIGRRLAASYGATLSVYGSREHKYWG